MYAADSTLTRRYALNVALIYLLIRSIPDLLLYVLTFLPEHSIRALIDNYSIWLRHLYPVVPLQLLNVSPSFQQTLSLLPVLAIEVLLVFLFSAWFLRRKPWAAVNPKKSRWILLVLAIIIWSFAVRHQLLVYIQSLSTAELRTRQNDENWIDVLPFLLLKAHWILTAVLYATTPLWAWLPTWLHFRIAQKPIDRVAQANDDVKLTSALGMSMPLQRAAVFASFLLGCLLLHIALVQLVYMGLWPWAVEQARISLPLDGLDETGLPMSLAQIAFAILMCALAAHFYVRGLKDNADSAVRLLLKPVLAGAVAYLLTCFLFLALLWFWMWLNPGFIDSTLRQLSDAPESGIVFLIALNIGALVLLCVVGNRLRASPRRWTAVLAVLILCTLVPSYVAWTLTASNLGIAGSRPGVAVTGELGDARWRSMEQWCTGVVETRHGTWVVGRKDGTRSASYVSDDALDLSTLLASDQDRGRQGGFNFFGSRPVLTTLALLQDDGRFKVMATIPDVVCMVVSPTSETLFLLTGLNRPQASIVEGNQTAVFRSRDHGTTWEWMESGFMSAVRDLAWSVRPTFSSELDVWAWGPEPSELFYSADQGKTAALVSSPEPLIASVSYLHEITGQPQADFSRRHDVDRERFVVQVSDVRAYAWVSESLWYRVHEDSHRLMLTIRAELSRSSPDSEWQVIDVTRQPYVRVKHLGTSLDGQTYVILDDPDGEWLVKFDPQTGEWIERQRTPFVLPGWLAEDQTATRYFWSNGDYQVVSLWGKTVLPRWLMPFSEERAEIDTDAHFYTRDGGRRWHQLAIPGYLGVMGLSAYGSTLYWSKGNWYSNDEPQQWEYDLSK